ncbi:LysR family transcriptional regulator [Variovorax davisae]|uniref:LysR family transcriptional regulator n=1 Tax=Variovorax davisae TaxID=3053515 RepID=UPI004037D22F
MKRTGLARSDLDLNLLQVILAIHDAGSVMEAAKQLGMSQPGLSTALQRARTALGDPLFVRVAKGFEPTARTRKIVGPIRSILDSVNKEVIKSDDFDPKAYTGELALVLTDVGEATLLPHVVNYLGAHFPTAIRTQMPALSELHKAMAEGTLDFALGYFPDLHNASYRRAEITTTSYLCILSSSHPIREGGISLAQFERFGHVDVDLKTHSRLLLDDYLASRGIHRRVQLRTRHFMSIPAIVAATDLIATVPASVVSGLGLGASLRIARTDFPVPSFESSLYWHASMHLDPRNRWLRQMLAPQLRTAIKKTPLL